MALILFFERKVHFGFTNVSVDRNGIVSRNMIGIFLTFVSISISIVSGIDTHVFCCYWASINQCIENPVYMRTKCQTSCGTIGCSGTNVAACKDVNPNVENCHIISPTSPTKQPPIIGGQEAKDFHPFCCYWAGTGQCIRNSMFMKLNCQKSCGTAGCTEETINTCHVKVDIGNCAFDLTKSKRWPLFQLASMFNNNIVKKNKQLETKEFVIRNTISAFQPFGRRGFALSGAQSQFSSPSFTHHNVRNRVDNILRKLQSLEQRLFPSSTTQISDQAETTRAAVISETTTKPTRPFWLDKDPNRALTENEQELFIRCKKLYSSIFSDFSLAARNFGAINFLSKPINTFLDTKQIDQHLSCKTLYSDIFQ